MNIDSLRAIEEYIEKYGFTVHLTDVNIQEDWNPIEVPMVGGEIQHFPGKRELQLNVTASLIPNSPAATSDGLKEAIERFDDSVQLFTEI